MVAFWNRTKKKNDDKKADKSSEVLVDKEKVTDKTKQDRHEKKVVKKSESDKKKKGLLKRRKKIKIKVDKSKAKLFNDVLVRPKVSEASLRGQEMNQYVFIVTVRANKHQIKEAIEAKYNVKVEKVNVMTYKKEQTVFRGAKGQKNGFKKAIVKLRAGDSIEFFPEK